jgi:hypothetical protein
MAGKKLRPFSMGVPPPCLPTPRQPVTAGANSHSRLHLIRLICCPRAGWSWRKPQACMLAATKRVCPCLCWPWPWPWPHSPAWLIKVAPK